MKANVENAKRLYLEAEDLELAKEWRRALNYFFYEENSKLRYSACLLVGAPIESDFYQYAASDEAPEFLEDDEIAAKTDVPVEVVAAYRERYNIPPANERLKEGVLELHRSLQRLAVAATKANTACAIYKRRFPKFDVVFPKDPFKDSVANEKD